MNDENKVYYLAGKKSIKLETFEQLNKGWSTATAGYIMSTKKNPGENGNHRNVVLGDGYDIGMILTGKDLAGPAIKLPDKGIE